VITDITGIKMLRGKGMAKATEFDRLTLLESAEGLVGAAGLEPGDHLLKGERRGFQGFHSFSVTINDSNKNGESAFAQNAIPVDATDGIRTQFLAQLKSRGAQRTTRPDER